ncbi:MAG: exonuclease SbcCD subunit D [Spirochaetes bacterium]|nr:exonuclease SbcCD subunit D [Spirochaetota bacterium]
MLTFIHISDTHLGFNDFDRVNNEGINQREADVYNAFATAVDCIIDCNPDFVLHTGDLFHRSSPSNRALIQGLQHIKRITQRDIPFIVIAGNHCTPKTIYTSPILQALQTIDGVYAVYNQYYECFSLNGIHFHCLPHIHDEAEYARQICMIQPKDGINILLMHTSLGKDYLLEEYGERIFPDKNYSLLTAFDYVALGHWHNYQVLPDWSNVCYSGSTERFSDREAGRQKGFVTVTIGTERIIKFTPISIRNWVRFDIKGCNQRSVEDIKKEIQEYSTKIEDGSIVSIYLHDIEAHQSAGISNIWIAQQFEHALIVLPKRIFKTHSTDSSCKSTHINIKELFLMYCKDKINDDKERTAVEELGMLYFKRYYDELNEMKG